MPCVVGPYQSLNATLTLLWDKVRTKSTIQGNYRDDVNYELRFGAVQSIATSSGQNDSGLFELNFHDERYLPFEDAGAYSGWRIELPLETNLFNRESLKD